MEQLQLFARRISSSRRFEIAEEPCNANTFIPFPFDELIPTRNRLRVVTGAVKDNEIASWIHTDRPLEKQRDHVSSVFYCYKVWYRYTESTMVLMFRYIIISSRRFFLYRRFCFSSKVYHRRDSWNFCLKYYKFFDCCACYVRM